MRGVWSSFTLSPPKTKNPRYDPVIIIVSLSLSLGSLSTDIRELQTTTGIRIFPGKALVGHLWLYITNVMASKRSNLSNKNRLPFAFCGSRTAVCA